ncbi:OmpH family outer membrane protein [Dysgonomonas sp. HDW5B]|uniref:OmpH family outer membrane protein n=1 Tax=Dysgonomonas sp. HDW5B TaxID=2714927 RepID=UPI00140856B5|nr:OmpH family outer membrane protein [Dysgonomonas sp. HDW5B]QIK54576.1 OmpH family outer membrane protein [Dysgonomonas sp. HDW5B]
MMAKRIFLSALFIISIVFINNISAQTSDKIAYINSIELLEVIPGKVAASRSISDLNQKYKDELAVMQNDYNNKYTDFLANQNKLAESIKLRRMQELYELEQNINRFMKVAQEDVESQEAQLIAPLKERLKEAVNQVGIEQGFTCIYDMANPAIAFITPNAIDANPMVKAKLQQTRR